MERNFISLPNPAPSGDFSGPPQSNKRRALPPRLFFISKFAHQPKHCVLDAVRREPLKESLNQDLFMLRLRLRCEQLRKRHAQCPSDSPQKHDRNISFPSFKLRKVPLRNIRLPRQHLARQSAPIAQFPHALPEENQKPVLSSGGRSEGRDILNNGVGLHEGRLNSARRSKCSIPHVSGRSSRASRGGLAPPDNKALLCRLDNLLAICSVRYKFQKTWKPRCPIPTHADQCALYCRPSYLAASPKNTKRLHLRTVHPGHS